MRKLKGLYAGLLVLGLSVVGMVGTSASAYDYSDTYYDSSDYYDGSDYSDDYYEEELDGDNSLYDLGLNESYSCSPEFSYNKLEYDVVVPAGTTKFDCDPVKSSSKSEITDITGTTLDENGKGTVKITVTAENGTPVTYYLYVTSKAEEKAATESESKKEKKKKKETEAATEVETETEAVSADQIALLASESEKQVLESEKAELSQKVAQLEQKGEQVNLLKGENDDLAYRLDMLMKVLYGLIAFAVLLLFFIINQSLRNKDLKDDIKKAKKDLEDAAAVAPSTEFYYAPVQQQPLPEAEVTPVFVPAEAEEAPLSRREQKRLEKEAKKAAKAEARQARNAKKAAPEETPAAPAAPEVPEFVPVDEPTETVKVEEIAPSTEPQLVKGKVDEPDVKVDMIEL